VYDAIVHHAWVGKYPSTSTLRLPGLTVIDLFCGAGGFSEGFRQMGFEVTFAVDNWKPAVQAYKLNHRETEVIQADIESLDPHLFPKPDVIIGSPPCTEFSSSKRGGSGDFGKGLRLVTAYLKFVQVLEPRWWLMENVPRLLKVLPRRVGLHQTDAAEDALIEVPRRDVFNSADFGVPQRRLRLISGRYPTPIPTHYYHSICTLDYNLCKPWVPMREVIDALPNPIEDVPKEEIVQDPNYDSLSVPAQQLEDHFMASGSALMTREEVERNRRQKTAHPYYGRMRFPDDLDRPARTVMAMQLNSSRETMVIETNHDGEARYRKPTVRECSSLQSYPITYRFFGNTLRTRYKLVGNSVPVKLSAALAKAILKEEGMEIPTRPLMVTVNLSS
jgi:DNA (cytosine-5)-methyltransferase 1